MPRIGLLLHVLESKLIFMTLFAIIGKRMPARRIRWISSVALQGVILGCLLTVFSYAMLPAWETCMVWLLARFIVQVVSTVLVAVVWQIGVLGVGRWVWRKLKAGLVSVLRAVGIMRRVQAAEVVAVPVETASVGAGESEREVRRRERRERRERKEKEKEEKKHKENNKGMDKGNEGAEGVEKMKVKGQRQRQRSGSEASEGSIDTIHSIDSIDSANSVDTLASSDGFSFYLEPQQQHPQHQVQREATRVVPSKLKMD